MLRHQQNVALAHSGKIDLLFLGDSITDRWTTGPGRDVWDAEYAPLHAADFGITGDRTQYLLWRIQHGELDGIRPKAVIIMIGTNNVPVASPPAIARAIAAIVTTTRAKLPRTRILLLGILPRDEFPSSPLRAKIATVNALLARLSDGRTVRYLDMGEVFLQSDGTISRDVMPDFIHPSAGGYRLWAQTMRPVLDEMMSESDQSPDRVSDWGFIPRRRPAGERSVERHGVGGAAVAR